MIMGLNTFSFTTVFVGMILFISQTVRCETIRIYGEPESGEIYGCSGRVLDWAERGSLRVGYVEDNVAYPQCTNSLYTQSNTIWAFRLPMLGEGKVIKRAVFNVYFLKSAGTEAAPKWGPTESLYGISYRSGNISEPALATDHFIGAAGTDNRSGYTLIQENIVSSYAVWQKWFASTEAGSAALGSYLRAQYENGAKAGDWVLLRQNPESIINGKTTREDFASWYYKGVSGTEPEGSYAPYIDCELEEASIVYQRPELKPGLTRVSAPIRHQTYYKLEKEVFGYNPRFALNSVQFGPDNRPYIRGGDWVYTLDDQGRWLKLDLKARVKQAFGGWSGVWETEGSGAEDRIIFDDTNDAYLIVNPAGYGYVLMYSRDLCRTWQVYQLPSEVLDVRMEFRDGHNEKIRPPVILTRTERPGGGSNYLKLFVPYKTTSGTLVIPAGVRLQSAISVVGGGLNAGKGASNLTVTRGNKTHIVFAGRNFEGADRGTPQYILTYDHTTGLVTPPIEQKPIYLGSAGDPYATEPDGHNWPAITMDSYGYIHVILGAHGSMNGQCFKYTKSLAVNSATSGWTPLENFQQGYTYPSLLCGANNKLHLIARDYWQPEMRLKYQCKPYGGAWGPRYDLVIPWDAGFYSRAPYSHYAAKFAQDRIGRLFVCYWNKRNLNKDTEEYNPAQFDAFCAKYPFDNGVDDQWHDPAMLMSDDGGVSWRLALSEDFVNGIQ